MTHRVNKIASALGAVALGFTLTVPVSAQTGNGNASNVDFYGTQASAGAGFRAAPHYDPRTMRTPSNWNHEGILVDINGNAYIPWSPSASSGAGQMDRPMGGSADGMAVLQRDPWTMRTPSNWNHEGILVDLNGNAYIPSNPSASTGAGHPDGGAVPYHGQRTPSPQW